MAAPQVSSARAPRLASFSTATGRRRRARRLGRGVDPDPAGEDRGVPDGAGGAVDRRRQAHHRADHAAAVDLRLLQDLVDELRRSGRGPRRRSGRRRARARPRRGPCGRGRRRRRAGGGGRSRSPARGRRRSRGRPSRRDGRRGSRPRGWPSRSTARPDSIRSPTIVEMVERERSVARASSAREARPRSRRASITRRRLPSRRDASEPLLLVLTRTQSFPHSSGFVKASGKFPVKTSLECAVPGHSRSRVLKIQSGERQQLARNPCRGDVRTPRREPLSTAPRIAARRHGRRRVPRRMRGRGGQRGRELRRDVRRRHRRERRRNRCPRRRRRPHPLHVGRRDRRESRVHRRVRLDAGTPRSARRRTRAPRPTRPAPTSAQSSAPTARAS